MGLNAKELESAKNEYALVCRIKGKSVKTLEHYESVIKQLIRSLGAEELAPGTVRSFLAGLLGDHKITTVSCYCRALRSFCHFLLRGGLTTDDDPMRDVRTPKVPRKYPYVLSEEAITGVTQGIMQSSFSCSTQGYGLQSLPACMSMMLTSAPCLRRPSAREVSRIQVSNW